MTSHDYNKEEQNQFPGINIDCITWTLISERSMKRGLKKVTLKTKFRLGECGFHPFQTRYLMEKRKQNSDLKSLVSQPNLFPLDLDKREVNGKRTGERLKQSLLNTIVTFKAWNALAIISISHYYISIFYLTSFWHLFVQNLNF